MIMSSSQCSFTQMLDSTYKSGERITGLLDMGLQVENMCDAESFTKTNPPGVGAWDWDQDEAILEELMLESGMCPEILYELLPDAPTQGCRKSIEQLSERWLPLAAQAKWDLDDTYLALQDIECDIQKFGGEWMPSSGLTSINRPLSGDAWSSKVVDEVTNELEWVECCEPSYFLEYDATGSDFVRDKSGRVIKSDAQRHEQQCTLNQLFNSSSASGAWTVENVTCEVACIGQKFGVAITPFGAAFVPMSAIKSGKVPEKGQEFTAQVRFNESGKYNLRVVWIQ